MVSVLVADNETHFIVEVLSIWLWNIGCSHSVTPAGHPCFNGQDEYFVRTVECHQYLTEINTP